MALPCLAIIFAALFLLTPNSVLFAQYLQPLCVAGALALWFAYSSRPARLRAAQWLFIGLGCVAAIRALGLSTWGVACAVEYPCSAAMRIVDAEMADARGKTAVLSSAYLYQAARHRDVRMIHSDWLQGLDRDQAAGDWKGLLELKPAVLVLTQFDYYRRYEPLVERLKEHPELATLDIQNLARVPAPDSFPRFRRILQHVSWAPVVIRVDWK